jgi:ABC-type transporter Mla subunit MlaD
MPHMSLAAIIPLVIDAIKQLMPIIEQFLQSNSSNSTNYNNGSESLDEYLKNTNEELSALQDKLAASGETGFDIVGEIKTAKDANDAADSLQKVLDQLPANSPIADDLRNEITALRKAAVELAARGDTGSGESHVNIQMHKKPDESLIPTNGGSIQNLLPTTSAT